MKKPSNLPRYKSGWGQWKYLSVPGPFYWGGGLHYVDKSGKFKHATVKEEWEGMKALKKKIMTKSEFNKKFGHLLKDKEYMNFLKKIKALI